MDVRILKTQHGRIIRLASALGGTAAIMKTSDDAICARELMRALNTALTEHLAIEDGELYPRPDAVPRSFGSRPRAALC